MMPARPFFFTEDSLIYLIVFLEFLKKWRFVIILFILIRIKRIIPFPHFLEFVESNEFFVKKFIRIHKRDEKAPAVGFFVEFKL